MRRSFSILLAVFAVAAVLTVTFAVLPKPFQVGADGKGGYIAATGQRVHPVGDLLVYPGRPVDMAIAPDGKTLFLKDDAGVTMVDAVSWKVRQRLPFPKGGGSMHGIVVGRDSQTVYATNTANELYIGTINDTDGKLAWRRTITLPSTSGKGASLPWGIALSQDEKTAYVCLSRNNILAVVDLINGTVVKEIPVGVAPYAVLLAKDGKSVYITNWGGHKADPKTMLPGQIVADTSGTKVPVDRRGIAGTSPLYTDPQGVTTGGDLSQVILETGREIYIDSGRHAADIALSRDGTQIFSVYANDDTITSNLASARVGKSWGTNSPLSEMGSAPNAVALSRDSETAFVAYGGLNAVRVLSAEGKHEKSSYGNGLIPTGWYPGAVTVSPDGQFLYIASVKGIGMRSRKTASDGYSVYNFQGTVQRIRLRDLKANLVRWTAQAKADSVAAVGITGFDPPLGRNEPLPKIAAKPVPIPMKIGAPSVFKHVVYIIKENRTYDQVFGDLKRGNGDPKFCLFGRQITPNHHALAEQFALLDNFYCNGVNSADGHSWATEGNCTDHLEKSFGGFARSYTFGDDALTYSRTGFIWDNVLDHGLTFRNYGEMDYTNEKPDVSYTDIYNDWQNKSGKITFAHSIGIARLKKYSHPTYPGWNMDVPDILRADIFAKDIAACEKSGRDLPNLSIVYLPNDHTTGTTPGDPTPRSYLADNDLALGRVVETISHSRFWKETCIFVVEDDSQAGVDHVDGHRSPCLVVSPYTRRRSVVSRFYNQTSVLHTIERILGLAPMNRMDGGSPLMTACFTTTPDFTAYICLPNNIPIAELNPKKVSGIGAKYADFSRHNDFSRPDNGDERLLNRAVWFAMRGKQPYPTDFSGAHGRGLKGLGLQLIPDSADD